jgi:hypothetical protein
VAELFFEKSCRLSAGRTVIARVAEAGRNIRVSFGKSAAGSLVLRPGGPQLIISAKILSKANTSLENRLGLLRKRGNLIFPMICRYLKILKWR